MLTQCCVCHQVKREGRWVRATQDDVIAEDISHTYCPTCLARSTAESGQSPKDLQVEGQDFVRSVERRNSPDRRRQLPAMTIPGYFKNALGKWQQDLRLQPRRLATI